MESSTPYLPRPSSTLSLLLISVGAAVFYHILRTIYRLSFHPLAKFPGPKLAAASYWYEYYHNVVLPGRYLWKIKALHQIYGKRSLPCHLSANGNRTD